MDTESNKIQQVSVKGIICFEGKILVLKTSEKGIYELPGGRINFGESPQQAFQREMKEEIGYENAELGGFVNMWSFTSVRGGMDHHFIILDFECSHSSPKIVLSDEHSEYKWIGPEDVEDIYMRDGHKESIRKYFAKHSSKNK